MSEHVIAWFKDVDLSDRQQVGGKGGSLGELERAGVAVPAGFVITTGVFERFVDGLERQEPLRARVQALSATDLAGASACCATIRERLEREPLPEEVLDQVSRAYKALVGEDGVAVAIRSSATTEDALDSSFAGLQDTYLWITHEDEVLRRVRACWSSLYSMESVIYRRRLGLPEAGVAMAVVVQIMVDARTAGVMFTRSPLTGDRSVVTIEASWGLGSAVVGGEVTPDRWVLSKITGDLSVRDISDKHIEHVPIASGGIVSVPVSAPLRRTPCLSDPELQSLRAIARRVEKLYGRAQDVEWAVARNSNALLLLQSRPETVWSARETAPVARPARDPVSHVMSIFGGKR